jgi:hypothetical protein
VFSDLVCFLLPLIVLLNLRMGLRLKILLCGSMSLGLACAMMVLPSMPSES